MTKGSEQKNNETLPDFITDKELVGTIVESVIIFLAIIIAVTRSRKKISQYANQYSNLLPDISHSRAFNKQINNTLTKMLALSASDRVILGQFHNGKDNSIEYFSASNEVTNIGISPISNKIKRIPKAEVAQEIQLLNSTYNQTIFTDISKGEIKTDRGTIPLEEEYRNKLLKTGISCSYELLVGEIGIIEIQYISKDENKLNIMESNKRLILRLRDYLRAIL